VLLAAYVDGISMRSSSPPIMAVDGKLCAELLVSVLSDPADAAPRSATLEPVLRVRASAVGS
jgi:hypothetical protein